MRIILITLLLSMLISLASCSQLNSWEDWNAALNCPLWEYAPEGMECGDCH